MHRRVRREQHLRHGTERCGQGPIGRGASLLVGCCNLLQLLL